MRWCKTNQLWLGSGYQAQHDDGHRHGGHFRAMPGFHDYGQKGWTFA